MKLGGGTTAAILTSLTLFACAAAPSSSQGPALEQARQAVEKYADAIRRLDSEILTHMSHPALVIREGGTEMFRQNQIEYVKFLKEMGWPESGSERRGEPSDAFIDGKTIMVGIPAVRKIPGKTADTAFVYVATSYDGGASWSILMLGCTDEKWLKGIAPGYNNAPDILGQGNPANATFEKTGYLDEAMFLKGTHWGTR